MRAKGLHNECKWKNEIVWESQGGITSDMKNNCLYTRKYTQRVAGEFVFLDDTSYL